MSRSSFFASFENTDCKEQQHQLHVDHGIPVQQICPILAFADHVDKVVGSKATLIQAYLELENAANNMGLRVNQEKTNTCF
jgi:hypothetical protein